MREVYQGVRILSNQKGKILLSFHEKIMAHLEYLSHRQYTPLTNLQFYS